jgi:hypothetical protein
MIRIEEDYNYSVAHCCMVKTRKVFFLGVLVYVIEKRS